MSWTVNQLRDLSKCGCYFRLAHIEQVPAALTFPLLVEKTHRQALRQLLAEGLTFNQYKNLFSALLLQYARKAQPIVKLKINQVLKSTLIDLRKIYAVLMSSNQIITKPWELDLEFEITLGERKVSCTIPVLSGKTALYWEFFELSKDYWDHSLMANMVYLHPAVDGVACCALHALSRTRHADVWGKTKPKECFHARGVVEDLLNQIRSGSFPRVSASSEWCRIQNCPYKGKCGKK